MITDTEGIILRQIKTVEGRRMLQIFSKTYGKISVGSNLSEGGKNKNALVIRPFTYGRYELFKSRGSYSLNGGQVIKSYYGIGENLDKYMAGSYALELTEKLLAEELPQPGLFQLLLGFLDTLKTREQKQETLVIAYMVKALNMLGVMPELNNCCGCGKTGDSFFFSVPEGGILCEACVQERIHAQETAPLIYHVKFDIIKILKYFQKEPFSAFEKIALDEEIQKELQTILKSYFAYHLDVKALKSECFSLLSEN